MAAIEGAGGRNPVARSVSESRQRRDGRAVGGDHRDAAEIEHPGERDDERRDARCA